MNLRRSTLLILLTLLNFGCSEDLLTEPNEGLYPHLGLGYADSLEAREMAFYWDNTLQGSDTTFESLLYHLNYLREVWGDSLPWIKAQRFILPWVPGELIVGLDSLATEEFRNGTYSGFNDLEEVFQPDSISEIRRSNYVLLYYTVPINMRVLANQYGDIQGVRYAEPNWIMWVGMDDFPMKYGIIDDEWAFIFLQNNSIEHSHYISYESGEPFYWGSDSTKTSEVRDVHQQWIDRGN